MIIALVASLFAAGVGLIAWWAVDHPTRGDMRSVDLKILSSFRSSGRDARFATLLGYRHNERCG